MRIHILALTLVPLAYGQTSSKCADLLRFKVPGVTMVITKAETVLAAAPGKAPLPSHCQAEGMIDQRTGTGGKTYGIGFAIALPDNWNNRFLFQGGGGFNGTVRPPLGAAAAGDDPALARGFAVVSTDTGHQGNDRTFFQDQQAGLDFAYVAVGRVAVLAKQVVAHYYGQPAKYSYFVGCSTGGREAMTMTQRYPDYFDGVIAGDPAMRTGYAEIGRTWTTVAFNQIAPKDDAGKLAASPVFSDGDKKLVVTGILNACDAKDGLKDGMIFNPQACKFDPAVLTCRGSKSDACLTSQQVGALKKAFAGPRNLRGDLVYPPSAYDAGISLPGVLRGPTLATEIDVDARMAAVLADAMNGLTDTTSTYLSSFSGHGGKLLFYHGMSDTGFSPLDTVDYYQKMTQANGGADQVQSWSRLYLVPGMGHCRGGAAALDDFDLLTGVVNWVEKGTAPDFVIATGKAFPGRSRPLCAYPKHAEYKGQGDPEDARNFACSE
ncbi:MAG: tannase/feruloyl esterase family alpha/beta hydrolase [Bryobacterales bacterium]|jgi:pimeloyl-ACP methyl ester carboxylesterase|nr:tannase/feruloyl esterase family alpha/beta hydrolase [Bryobacterales bacterium]